MAFVGVYWRSLPSSLEDDVFAASGEAGECTAEQCCVRSKDTGSQLRGVERRAYLRQSPVSGIICSERFGA